MSWPGDSPVTTPQARRDRSRLTILFLSREYPPETGGGGIGSYVAAIAPALAARGHDVHTLSCAPGQATRDYRDGDAWIHRRGTVNLRLSRLRPHVQATASRLEAALSCYLEARRLDVQPDLLEAPDWMAEGLLLTLVGSKPVVGHLHTPLRLTIKRSGGTYPWTIDRRLADRIERLAVRRSFQLTSPSRLLVDDLARDNWFGAHAPGIFRYGVDAERWDGISSASSTEPLVLGVGRLEARKAPDILIEAAGRLSGVEGLDVVFVGREQARAGPFSLQWLQERARAIGAPIRFLGSVSRNELRGWYAAARVVVVPSRYDNFPFVALEAMAAGRAVVCTATTGTAELADDSEAITVVPPEDAGALASALRPFLDDAEFASRAGAQARELVLRECGLDRISAEREAFYREVVANWEHRRKGRRRPAA